MALSRLYLGEVDIVERPKRPGVVGRPDPGSSKVAAGPRQGVAYTGMAANPSPLGSLGGSSGLGQSVAYTGMAANPSPPGRAVIEHHKESSTEKP